MNLGEVISHCCQKPCRHQEPHCWAAEYLAKQGSVGGGWPRGRTARRRWLVPSGQEWQNWRAPLEQKVGWPYQ
jgi:hypothetical protein